MIKEIVVAKEEAEKEFDRFFDCMDIYIDESELDADDLSAFRKLKGKLIRSIMYGHLTFNDNGEAVYKPFKSPHTDAITFHERKGSSLIAIDGKKKGHDVAKMYAMMADMTGLPQNVFSKLNGIDIKICEGIFTFLMD